MRLHGYFRSSAAYRVRIALNLKGIAVQHVSWHLRDGRQRSPEFLGRNPQGLVPVLETDEGLELHQSLAIVEYVEERYPAPPLLPADAGGRARVRGIAQEIACDIHPLDNLRVLNYLRTELGHDQATVDAWYRHWVEVGFEGLEERLAGDGGSGTFCHGDTPTLADACLVPQVYNARRFEVDVAAYPTIARIDAACSALPPFADAAPDRQPDAEV